MKKITLLLSAVLFAAMSFAVDYASTHTSNVTFVLGEKAYADKVKIEGVEYEALKLGTSSVVGDATFNIPAGTTKIHLHVAGWKGKKSEATLSANNGVTLSVTTLAPESNDGIANNSPYTLVGDPTAYYQEIVVTGATSETTITVKTVAGKTRVVFWGVNTEVAVAEDAEKFKVTVTSEDEEMGTVAGSGEYAEGTVATLTAIPNPGFEFVKWSNGSTENPLKLTVTENVTLTASFKAQEVSTCADVKDFEVGEAFILGEFTVAYVNGSYTYIKDATGSSLIYSYNFGLKAGDVVKGFAGTRAEYNGLVQITPSVTVADLTITEGAAPTPVEMTVNPTLDDMNTYVVFKNLTMEAATINADSRNVKGTLPNESEAIAFYNQFKIEFTFDATKKYDVVGAVGTYKGNVQVNFISATVATTTDLEDITVNEKVAKIIKNGQIYIIKGGKTYNALGAEVK